MNVGILMVIVVHRRYQKGGRRDGIKEGEEETVPKRGKESRRIDGNVWTIVGGATLSQSSLSSFLCEPFS